MQVPQKTKEMIARELRRKLHCDLMYEARGAVKIRIYEIDTLVDYICEIFKRGAEHGIKQKKAEIMKAINKSLEVIR